MPCGSPATMTSADFCTFSTLLPIVVIPFKTFRTGIRLGTTRFFPPPPPPLSPHESPGWGLGFCLAVLPSSLSILFLVVSTQFYPRVELYYSNPPSFKLPLTIHPLALRFLSSYRALSALGGEPYSHRSKTATPRPPLRLPNNHTHRL